MAAEQFDVPDPLGEGTVKVVGRSARAGRPPSYQGKVRDIYDAEEQLLIVASDRVSAFDRVLPTLIPHKGVSLHALSVYWFERTRGIFPNHYLASVDARTMRVQRAERIDIEWIVRRHLYGSAWRQYQRGERTISGVRFPDGLRLAEELPDPVVTPTTKSATGHDAPITKAQAIEQGLVTPADWTTLEEATLRLFEFYRDTARTRGIIIPDFKLEFGRVAGQLVQIDEPPTHDSARFWSAQHFRVGARQESHCLDKEFLRAYLLGVGFSGDSTPPTLPPGVVAEVARRCVGAYRVLSGRAALEELALKSVDDVLR